MWMRRLIISIVLSSMPFSAIAFDRLFPDGAKRGTISFGDYPQVVLNGKPRKLSAAAHIRNADNLLVQPSYLIGEKNLPINYTEDIQGEIDGVWILTKAESAEGNIRTISGK